MGRLGGGEVLDPRSERMAPICRRLRPVCLLILLVCLVALAVGPAPAVAPPARPAARLDRHGDPLPDGALARLGTLRFRALNEGLVCLTRDGKTVAVVEGPPHRRASAIRLLDVGTGKVVRRLVSNEDVALLGFCPTGRALLVAEQDGHVLRFLAVDTGQPVREVDLKGLNALSVAFSGDGKRMAVGCAGQQAPAESAVHVFQVATGRLLRSFKLRYQGGARVDLSADGKALATWDSSREEKKGAPECTVEVWDLATGKARRRVGVGPEVVERAAFSPDGKVLALATARGVVQLWGLASGKRLRAVRARRNIGEHLSFTRDGKALLAAGPAGVQGWEVGSGRRLRLPPGPPCVVWALEVAADGRVLACGRDGQAVVVWDVLSGKGHGPGAGHRYRVSALSFSAAGTRVRSVGLDGTALEWDRTGRPRRTLCRGAKVGLGELELTGGVVVSPDGKHFLSVGEHGLELREPATGQEALTIEEGQGPAVFSADGALFAACVGGENGERVGVWKVSTGEEVSEFEVKGEVICLAFGPGEQALAVGAVDGNAQRGEVRLWQTSTGKPVSGFKPLVQSEADIENARLVFSPRRSVPGGVGGWDDRPPAGRGHGGLGPVVSDEGPGPRPAGGVLAGQQEHRPRPRGG
jgi:WD40 repeat protein